MVSIPQCVSNKRLVWRPKLPQVPTLLGKWWVKLGVEHFYLEFREQKFGNAQCLHIDKNFMTRTSMYCAEWYVKNDILHINAIYGTTHNWNGTYSYLIGKDTLTLTKIGEGDLRSGNIDNVTLKRVIETNKKPTNKARKIRYQVDQPR